MAALSWLLSASCRALSISAEAASISLTVSFANVVFDGVTFGFVVVDFFDVCEAAVSVFF